MTFSRLVPLPFQPLEMLNPELSPCPLYAESNLSDSKIESKYTMYKRYILKETHSISTLTLSKLILTIQTLPVFITHLGRSSAEAFDSLHCRYHCVEINRT